MTSIHTNQGAMIALSTLQMINRDLLETNTQISTGRTINTAADNAAIWAVTTVMNSDVRGFEAISEALDLGSATVTVARSAAEKVADLLTEMKELIVTAQGSNIDREAIQRDIDELKTQIDSIVEAAQFNGLNLLNGSESEIEVISSLDRSDDGVSTNSITVTAQNLSGGAANAGDTIGSQAQADLVSNDNTAAAYSAVGTASADFTIANTTGTGESEIEIYITDEDNNKTFFGSVTIDDQATVDQRATTIATYINSRNDTISAEVSASGVVSVFNEDAYFENIDIEMVSTGGTSTINGNASDEQTANSNVGAVAIASDDANTQTINIAGAITTGEDIYFTIENANGDQITGTFTLTSTTVATEEQGLANELATQIAGSSVEFAADLSVYYDGTDIQLVYTGGEDLDLTLTTDSASGTLAFSNGVTTGDDITASNAGGTGTIVAEAAVARLNSNDTLKVGEGYRLSINKDLDGDDVVDADEVINFDYIVQTGDDYNDVMSGIEALIQADSRMDDVYVDAIFDTDVTTSSGFTLLQIDSLDEDMSVVFRGFHGGTAGGGLGKLAGIDVTTTTSAAQALDDIEDLIQTAIDAAAAFGSSETRIQIQSDFVSSLIDSMNTGIGALVDTDMESASARLSALQTQQQLGTQALAIANATPQTILTLFG